MGMIVTGQNLDSTSDSNDFQNFQKILNLSKDKLIYDNPNGYRKNSEEFWKAFEDDVSLAMQKACNDLSLGWTVDHLGGHKFPDIVARINNQKSFGVEVKTLSASSDNWRIMGGSIMESTSEKDVSRIHVFCAKKNPFDIRFRSFEDCVRDVAVTHSPRYMLDLDISSDQSIFQKIKKPYSEVRKMDNPFSAFKNYLIAEKSQNRHDENTWWMDSSNVTSDQDSAEKDFVTELENTRIRFWDELDKSKKQNLIARMIILFPEVLNGNYKEAAKWLYRHLVINPSFRDTFSAGGKGCVNGITVPKILVNLDKWKQEIAGIFKYEFITLEDRFSLSELPSNEKPKVAWANWKFEAMKNSFMPQETLVFKNIVDEIGRMV